MRGSRTGAGCPDVARLLHPARALVLALVATLVLGAVLTFGTMRLETRAEAARFDRLADLIAGNIRQRLVRHVSLLRATASLMTAENGDVDAAEFASYVTGLNIADSAAGIQGFGFAPIIAESATSVVNGQLSELQGRPVAISPPTGEATRAPVALLEPRDARNETAIGFDLLSEPARRAAILATLSSGEPRATAPVQLVQEITADKQEGFLIVLRTRTGLAGVSGTGTGVVYAPFRAGDLFRAILAQTPGLPVTVSARDMDAPERTLFDSADSPAPDALAARAVTRDIQIAGRRWRLTLTPSSPQARMHNHTATLIVGLLSLLLLGAVGVAMDSLRRSLDAAHRAAAMAQQQAADRALLLREMQHRIKNHIARIQAIARQSVRGAADLPEFERIFDGRMAAMAKAQDQLVAGGAQQAELRGLLRAELKQVLDGAAADLVLTGPDLRLNSREAQAVGLVAHELVTNAVKYSPEHRLTDVANGLAVSWHTVDRADGRWLTLDWTEPQARFQTAAPDTGPRGFGTQLIEALIEGDLGGRFSRSFDDAGMHVTLSFPLSAA